MSKLFALFAIALIVSGALVLAVPREPAQPEASRSLAPQAVSPAIPAFVLKARDFAEQVNAPLSILFGLVSLFYSRRTYLVNKARADAQNS